MRKLFAIGIAAALALSTGVVVFAESSEKTIGGNESQSINVIQSEQTQLKTMWFTVWI